MDEDKLVTMYERESGEKRIDSNGNVVEHKIATYAVKKEKLANTGGTKLIKFKKLLALELKYRTSPNIVGLLALAKSTSEDSVMIYEGKILGTATISSLLECNPSTVTRAINTLVSERLLKKVGRTIYVNPYIIMPYAISNHNLHLLQLLWDNNFVPLEYEVDDRDGVEFLRDHLDGIE